KKLTLLMFMRMGRAAEASRFVALVPVGVVFTDTAGLTEACMILGPRDRYASGKNRPGQNVDNQDQAQQDQPRGPGLPAPIFIRRNGVDVYHVRKRLGRLVPPRAPVAISQGGE